LVAVESGEGIYLPIPLTEEWLVKLGFKKNIHIHEDKSKSEVYKKGRVVVTMVLSVVGDGPLKAEAIISLLVPSNNRQYNYVTELHNIHQIQNLYFSLTGEELTITQ